ncbi:MAG TPA: hypothetical protein GXZ82_15890 [Firmicutes bacterium]|nr:hypothetical protein [Bacillota bacterium]
MINMARIQQDTYLKIKGEGLQGIVVQHEPRWIADKVCIAPSVAKFAGSRCGSTIIIIALSYEPKRTKQAILEAGADRFIELDPHAHGVTVEYLGEGYERVAATGE